MKNKLEPDKWLDNYGDYMYSFAYMRVSDANIAEDLVQDTFLSALKAKDNFEGKASEKTWLISIMKNKIIDHYRKAGRKDKEGNRVSGSKNVRIDSFFHEGEWTTNSRPANWNTDYNQAIESKEFFEIFHRCVSKMTGKGAIAFKMKYIDQEETKEICKTLDITSSNYWVLIHRAKLQLKECLDKNWFKELDL